MNQHDTTPTPPAAPDTSVKPEAAERSKPAPGLDRKGRVRTTRAGAWWTALVLAAAISIVFLIFIVQNAESVTIRFLGFDGQVSLAVALLLSAVLGVLVVAIPGAARIFQLRHALRRSAKR